MTNEEEYLDRHKRGDGFIRTLVMPNDLADGHFVGYTVDSQLRNGRDALIATFAAAWVDPLTTRHLTLTCADTTTWPTERLRYDVQFTRTSDAFPISTETVFIQIDRDETRPV